MRNFAQRLIVYEARENRPARQNLSAAFQACEKLHMQLAKFIGNTGFRTVFSHALALSAEEVAWLRGVRVTADGPLEGLEELQAQLSPDELFEGGVVLLAQLLGLLVAFIGANLTVRLVCEVWPKVPLNDLGFDNGGKNEKK
jgi:hypothetical protein